MSNAIIIDEASLLLSVCVPFTLISGGKDSTGPPPPSPPPPPPPLAASRSLRTHHLLLMRVCTWLLQHYICLITKLFPVIDPLNCYNSGGGVADGYMCRIQYTL